MSGAASLGAQTPELAWSEAMAGGALSDLRWVGVGQEGRFSLRTDAEGELRWSGEDLLRHLPPSLAEAAAEAQREGRPGAWEGLALVFATPSWTVASRGLLWTPSSPRPRLLASLVEAAGIEPVLHRGDPDRLRRLAALLPRWAPRRGTVARAVEVLEAAGASEVSSALIFQTPPVDDEQNTAPSATAGEVFAARGAAFWARRQVAERTVVLRISGGLLRFQPRVDVATALRREDLLLRVGPDLPSGRDLFRLLPAWTVPRPVGPAISPVGPAHAKEP